MTQDDCRIVKPTVAMGAEFVAYCEERKAAGEPARELEAARQDFLSLVRQWEKEAAGQELAAGKVPQSWFWLVRDRKIIGTARLRHSLNDALLRGDGQIGYDVRPSERGQGYATRLLALMLEQARAKGLDRVLVTCHRRNAASARVIIKNGGVLENEVNIEEDGVTMQRYWIDL